MRDEELLKARDDEEIERAYYTVTGALVAFVLGFTFWAIIFGVCALIF
jgi:hypothetical protein